MSSERLFLIVESATRRAEVALPGDVPIAGLVPGLVEMHEGPAAGGSWVLARPDGGVLPGNLSLVQCGAADGDVLALRPMDRDPTGAAEPPMAQPEPDGGGAPPTPQPQPEVMVRSGGALSEPYDGAAEEAQQPPERPSEARAELPDALPLPDRLRAVAEALVSPDATPASTDAPAASPDRLAIPRQRSPLDRAREAWRTSDYRTRLDQAIAAPRLGRCVTIAVISPKGGVGKTTTTVALATLLAMLRSDRVVAVDSNPDHGTLGRSISPDHPIFVDDLLQVLHQPALTVTMLERCLGRAQHGLMVLPAPIEPDRMEALDEQAYLRVVTRLQELAGIIVLDCGPGMYDPATRAALKLADQLVVVSDAEPRTASLVAEAALRLPASTSYTFVVNREPRSGSRLDVGHLAEDLTTARGLVRVESDPAAASRVAEGEFTWNDAPESWHLAFRELAVILSAEWESLPAAD